MMKIRHLVLCFPPTTIVFLSERKKEVGKAKLPKAIQGFCPSSKHSWLGDPPGTFLTNDLEAKVSSTIRCCLSRKIFLGKLCSFRVFFFFLKILFIYF